MTNAKVIIYSEQKRKRALRVWKENQALGTLARFKAIRFMVRASGGHGSKSRCRDP